MRGKWKLADNSCSLPPEPSYFGRHCDRHGESSSRSPFKEGLASKRGSTVSRQPLSDSCRELLHLRSHPPRAVSIWGLTIVFWRGTLMNNSIQPASQFNFCIPHSLPPSSSKMSVRWRFLVDNLSPNSISAMTSGEPKLWERFYVIKKSITSLVTKHGFAFPFSETQGKQN